MFALFIPNTTPTLNFSRLARSAWTGFPQNRILPAPSKNIINRQETNLNCFLTQTCPPDGTVEERLMLAGDANENQTGTKMKYNREVEMVLMGH